MGIENAHNIFYSFLHAELADDVCLSEDAAEASSLYS